MCMHSESSFASQDFETDAPLLDSEDADETITDHVSNLRNWDVVDDSPCFVYTWLQYQTFILLPCFIFFMVSASAAISVVLILFRLYKLFADFYNAAGRILKRILIGERISSSKPRGPRIWSRLVASRREIIPRVTVGRLHNHSH
ncbi:calcium-dependent secretion activator 1 [Trichinella spiralis]|uniref:calcium-dependent secretion activator 1 n=1 Tax=Trichinella spiralis TaxID=6334 RepID=UPI0001EFC72C|nr:calcium-dependent secretion activator 1 [Trichinella spiralis]